MPGPAALTRSGTSHPRTVATQRVEKHAGKRDKQNEPAPYHSSIFTVADTPVNLDRRNTACLAL